jgi:chloramphenicol-sensitive protein RarD
MNVYLGTAAATAAFIIWGFLPVYWKHLETVPAYEILCHRMFWALVVTAILVFATGRARHLRKALTNRKELLLITTTATLLAVNWLTYIWAVNAGFIVETSLGYFINPLLNVLLGMIFFKERMRLLQWAALAFALAGVLYLTFYYGKFPWIALVLATSFAIYGLLHKKTSLGALDGLCLETSVFFVPAAAILVGLHFSGEGAFLRTGWQESLLLVGAGVVTTVTLLLFGFAAHRIRLSTIGILQYLAPSINLLLGVYIYQEEFPIHRMIGFCLIWVALALYLLESVIERSHVKKCVLSEST